MLLSNQTFDPCTKVEGLSTVLTGIVDYKGQRIVGQSIIPGVLMSGLGAARLMYA